MTSALPISLHPPPASQVALKNCSAEADTRCGCGPDWFVECLVTHCIGGSPFRCHPCLDCGTLHRHTWVPCEYPLQMSFLPPHSLPLPPSFDPYHLLDCRFQQRHRLWDLSAWLLRIWQQLCVLPHVTSWLPWAGGRLGTESGSRGKEEGPGARPYGG